MKQITEDFVSYKVACLLKEKGFDEDSWFHFDSDGDVVIRSYRLNRPNEIPAWTHQMALKWLREAHRIEVNVVLSELNIDNIRKYMFDIYSSDRNNDFNSIQKDGFDSHEETVEAAILYVLKNLI